MANKPKGPRNVGYYRKDVERFEKVINPVDPRRKTSPGNYHVSRTTWKGTHEVFDMSTKTWRKASKELSVIGCYEINDFNLLRNQMVRGMRNQLGSFQDIAESFAEGHEAISYLTHRAQQGLDILLGIRKGRVKYVAKQFHRIAKRIKSRKRLTRAERMFYKKMFAEKQKKKTWAERAEAIPDGWLEYHFAVAPLMSIPGQLRQAFESPPMPTLKSTARGPIKTKRVDYMSSGSKELGFIDSVDASERYTYVCHMKISSVNPNTLLFKRFGLASPLAVAWAVVPMSWFVDYFYNVGELIDNLTNPYLGVSVKSASVGTKHEAICNRVKRVPASYSTRSGQVFTLGKDYGGINMDLETRVESFSRAVGIPDLSYRVVINPQPLNVQRLSYILSVAKNLFK